MEMSIRKADLTPEHATEQQTYHLTGDQQCYIELWQQLMLCSKKLEQEISNRFRKQFKQSLIRYELLSQLDEGKWLAIGKVAQQLISSNGNITKLVDRMYSEELLIRRRNQHDKRIIEIGLSEKGQQLLIEMNRAHGEWTQSLLSSRVADKEARQLLELWQRANQAG
ncbi:MarR family winged helix-turn-helix transcriptional regulator [Oceanicoccus sp. KOV_DT_Chl]|uniref:MarR family winged helix-turn-helix transcriptional regulator n=1 Tax=Oceanicoccus sp. KOV_DT_Chl TaxID=1904639 RepID=UPI000C7E5630|nr:MarR family transcriptional regulator [Oceanicoccus sp. KOV_DT_Chl]